MGTFLSVQNSGRFWSIFSLTNAGLTNDVMSVWQLNSSTSPVVDVGVLEIPRHAFRSREIEVCVTLYK